MSYIFPISLVVSEVGMGRRKVMWFSITSFILGVRV